VINQADWNFAILIALAFYLLSAYIFGRLEKFTFGDCELHVGPPDLLGFFQKGYHVPLAAIFLTLAICYDLLIWNQFEKLFGVVLFFPTWCWLEDMSYFINNPFDRLDDKAWVTGGLGGVRIFGQFVPWVYVGFFVSTCFIVWWRIL
jgi:hypothetical protein